MRQLELTDEEVLMLSAFLKTIRARLDVTMTQKANAGHTIGVLRDIASKLEFIKQDMRGEPRDRTKVSEALTYRAAKEDNNES